MRFIQTFQLYDFLDTLVSLLTAFVLGTLIGAERQYRQRSAGLRTNVLVAVGAAVWLPGAIVIKLGALLRPRRQDETGDPFPAGGPAMDL